MGDFCLPEKWETCVFFGIYDARLEQLAEEMQTEVKALKNIPPVIYPL